MVHNMFPEVTGFTTVSVRFLALKQGNMSLRCCAGGGQIGHPATYTVTSRRKDWHCRLEGAEAAEGMVRDLMISSLKILKMGWQSPALTSRCVGVAI